MPEYRAPYWPERAASPQALLAVTSAPIAYFPWKSAYPYCPSCEARLASFGDGIGVLLSSEEHPVRCEVKEPGGPVHLDSCLEFFINFSPNASDNYFNFELNPLGVLHLAIGPDRNNRKLLASEESASFFSIQAEATEAGWNVFFIIPHSFIQSFFPDYKQESAKPLANFYKCGDNTLNPHFGCWNEVKTAEPDFHRPEFFAPIRFVKD